MKFTSPYVLKLSMFVTGIALIIGSMLLPGAAVSTFAGPPLEITGSPTIPPLTPPATDSGPQPPYADPYVLKTCNMAEAKPGEDVEFTIVAGNRGTESAVNVQVRDTLPPQLTLKAVTASPRGTVTVSGNSFVVDIGTLGVSELITIKVTATINATANPGPYTNVAILNTTSGGDNPDNNISVATCNIGQVIMPPSGGPAADSSTLPFLFMAMGAALIVGSLFIRQRRPE